MAPPLFSCLSRCLKGVGEPSVEVWSSLKFGIMIQLTAENRDRLLNNSPVGLISPVGGAVFVYSKSIRE